MSTLTDNIARKRESLRAHQAELQYLEGSHLEVLQHEIKQIELELSQLLELQDDQHNDMFEEFM